jgi:hypothetical protein
MTHRLNSLTVEMSAPRLIGRSQEEFWFPQIHKFPNGDLLLYVRLGGDDWPAFEAGHGFEAALMWSKDEGRTWSKPKRVAQSTSQLALPSGDLLLLPFFLYRRPDWKNHTHAAGVATVVSDARRRSVVRADDGVVLESLPRAEAPAPHPSYERFGLSGFYFDGHAIASDDGTWLATCYGTFAGNSRYSALLVESADGRRWHPRSIISDGGGAVSGAEGACEPSVCRLKDSRLMAVFRTGGGYGQTWSSDDGHSWSDPVRMTVGTVGGAEPRLITMSDGTVLLLGGRDKGLSDFHLWIDRGGSGTAWQALNLAEHHNRFHPEEPFPLAVPYANHGGGRCSGYIHAAVLDAHRIVLVYDRTPLSYFVQGTVARTRDHLGKDDPRETFSCWSTEIAFITP